MKLAAVAWKNLGRRPARSLLAGLGLTIAVACVVALVGLSQSLESSFLSLYTRRGADLVIQRRGGTVQLAKGLPLSLADRIRRLPDVVEVISGLMDMIAFEDEGLFMVIVNGWEPDCPVLDRVNLVAGRRLQAGDEHCAMLGRILAANLNKRPGDTIDLYSQPYKVIGIHESFSVYENGSVFLLMEDLQRLMDRPGQATGFVVQVRHHGDAAEVARVQRQIEALDPEIAAVPCSQFVASLTQIRVTKAMAWMASAIALVIGAAGVANTMAMSTLERRSEIGTLRALGWSQSRVLSLIVSEALLLAMVGALCGSTIGLAIISGLSRWHVTSGLVQGDWPWNAVAVAILLALVTALLGAVVPAWKAARESPVEALRGS